MFNNATKKKMKQITNNIMMIEPVAFRFNEQTAVNNYYQKVLDNLTPEQTQQNALSEFNNFVSILRDKGVNVVVIKDTKSPDTPDSIFPNNWVSFHESGNIALYPMCAENRREERREDIFDALVDDYNFEINYMKDFTEFEDHNKFLEGTGSMVLDRENKRYFLKLNKLAKITKKKFNVTNLNPILKDIMHNFDPKNDPNVYPESLLQNCLQRASL